MLHAMIMAGGGDALASGRAAEALGRNSSSPSPASGRCSSRRMTGSRRACCRRNGCGSSPARRTARRRRHGCRQLRPDQVVGEPCGRDTAACIALGARRDRPPRRRRHPARHPGRPRHRAGAGVPPRVHAAGAMVAEHPGAHRHLRHPADVRRHRLRLHPPRRAGGAAAGTWACIASPRSARKPLQPQADAFFASGEYFWNSGIFVWKAATVLAALKQHRPGVHDAVARIAAAWDTPRRAEVLARSIRLSKR
ncbi:MAG: sugar phosphate nucleotidyltransferase [Gemmataceae bacterium]